MDPSVEAIHHLMDTKVQNVSRSLHEIPTGYIKLHHTEILEKVHYR